MAIEINGYNSYQNTINLQVGNTEADVTLNSNTPSSNGNEQTSIAPGQILSGEITVLNDDNITIRLSNNSNLNATLENNMNLKVGQQLLFQVGVNEESTVLRPLYTNLNNSSEAAMALRAANLPTNATNMLMVSTMMDEGMNINANALNSMARIVKQFNTTNPATLVELRKLDMPINESNITQFENYRNFEHQIINDVAVMTDGLADMVGTELSELQNYVNNSPIVISEDANNPQIITDNNTLQTDAVYVNEASLINTNTVGVQLTEVNGDFVPLNSDNLTNISEGDSSSITTSVVLNTQTGIDLTNEILSFVTPGDKDWNGILNVSTNVVSPNQTLPIMASIDVPVEGNTNISVDVENVWAVRFNPDEAPDNQMSADINLKNPSANTNAETNLSDNQMSEDSGQLMKNLAQNLKELGMPPEELSNIEKNTMTVNDLVDFVKYVINNKLKTNSLDDSQLNALNKLINNNDFKQLVGNQLMKQMLLNPKDIAKDGAVEELYKQLSQDSQKIIELLNNAGKQDSAALKSASNLSDNVNFMNQLNSMMSYVQLPLRMNQENTHGELYVYSRKKNLSSKNDNVSAFLHLDMDNLGPMDVYVALQSNKVSTNFTLADVDTLDFIEKNIHILNERLENKGYSMSTNVSVKSKSEPAKTIVKEALKMKSNGVIPEGMISKMAFDVRA